MNKSLKTTVLLGAISGLISISLIKESNKCSLSKERNKLLDNVVCVKKAIENQSNYSIFVNQLVTAQAILESNLLNNPSKLAIDDNNLFGIKCSIKVENCSTYKTTEYVKGKKLSVNARFAHFNSIEDGVKFRLQMFEMPRYQNVKFCISFEDCAVRVQKSGYATDPNYSKELIRVYKENIK